jgi:hypothetical protein
MDGYAQYTSTLDVGAQDQAHVNRDAMADLNRQLTAYHDDHPEIGSSCWPD